MKLKDVKAKFESNVDDRQLFIFPKSIIEPVQYHRDSLEKLEDFATELHMKKTMQRKKLLSCYGKIRPEMFGLDEKFTRGRGLTVQTRLQRMSQFSGMQMHMCFDSALIEMYTVRSVFEDVAFGLEHCPQTRVWYSLEESL
jgi:hypothetical protein